MLPVQNRKTQDEFVTKGENKAGTSVANLFAVGTGEPPQESKKTVRGGKTDYPISEAGIEQIKRLATAFLGGHYPECISEKSLAKSAKRNSEQPPERMDFSAMYSSHLQQGLETAAIFQKFFAASLNKDLTHSIERNLRGKEWGDLEGLPESVLKERSKAMDAVIEQQFPGQKEQYKKQLLNVKYFNENETEAAESDNEVAERVKEAMIRIAQENPNGCVLIVGHSNALRNLRRSLTGSNSAVSHREVIWLRYDSSKEQPLSVVRSDRLK